MREQMPRQEFGISESSMQQDYEKAHMPSSVDKGVVDNLNNQAKTHITNDIAPKADEIENRVEHKMMQTESAYDSAQNKMSEQATQLEAQHQQGKEKVGIKDTAMQGAGAVIDGGAKTIDSAVDVASKEVISAEKPLEALKTLDLSEKSPQKPLPENGHNTGLPATAKNYSPKGIHFVEDHSDGLAAANPSLMMQHPHQNTEVLETASQNKSDLSPEPIQKIVKINQVMNAPEVNSIDLNQRKYARVTKKD
jgi:hypothetical protein